MNVHVARALATFFSRHEIDLANIGNKVGMKNTAVIFGEIFAVFGEKFRIAGIETVFEHVIRVEDQLRDAEELEGYRLARQGKVPARLGPAGIVMLMPGIEWNRKSAPSFPFKDPLRRAVIPHGGGAAPGGNGDDLLIELALWFHALARGDFGDVGIGDHLVGERANGAVAVFTLPIIELFRPHVS